jgi:hypothetical protein
MNGIEQALEEYWAARESDAFWRNKLRECIAKHAPQPAAAPTPTRGEQLIDRYSSSSMTLDELAEAITAECHKAAEAMRERCARAVNSPYKEAIIRNLPGED